VLCGRGDAVWPGWPRKVDVRLLGEGNSNTHGARPVHLIVKMIQLIRTSRLSMKNSLSLVGGVAVWLGWSCVVGSVIAEMNSEPRHLLKVVVPNSFTLMSLPASHTLLASSTRTL
jgi:hypothetical protein